MVLQTVGFFNYTIYLVERAALCGSLDDCSTRLPFTSKRAAHAARFRFRAHGEQMHLLYLDESGHSHDPETDFFVLAGFSVFERSTHWLETAITPIAERFNPTDPDAIEFHGSPMRGGSDGWKGYPPAQRVQAVVDILALLANPQLKLRVFASVIEKSTMAPDDILAASFENVAMQFDKYLASMYLRKDPQRGLVIFDKTSYEEKLQALSSVFKRRGHSLGKLRNFAEVPLFLDSKASRLIQMADIIAYWLFRYFQSGDDRGYKLIEPYFHTHRDVNHGFVKRVTPECEARLVALAPAIFPFPAPTPLSVQREMGTWEAPVEAAAVIEVRMATTEVTIPVSDQP